MPLFFPNAKLEGLVESKLFLFFLGPFLRTYICIYHIKSNTFFCSILLESLLVLFPHIHVSPSACSLHQFYLFWDTISLRLHNPHRTALSWPIMLEVTSKRCCSFSEISSSLLLSSTTDYFHFNTLIQLLWNLISKNIIKICRILE